MGYNPSCKWDKSGWSTYNWGYNPLTKWVEPPSIYIFHICRTYSIDIPMITVLVGGFNLPLWKIWVRQLGWLFHIISNIWKNKTYSKHPTSCIVGCSFVASLAACRFYCPHLCLQIHQRITKRVTEVAPLLFRIFFVSPWVSLSTLVMLAYRQISIWSVRIFIARYSKKGKSLMWLKQCHKPPIWEW